MYLSSMNIVVWFSFLGKNDAKKALLCFTWGSLTFSHNILQVRILHSLKCYSRMSLVYKIDLVWKNFLKLVCFFVELFNRFFFANKSILLNYYLYTSLLNLLCYFHMVCVMWKNLLQVAFLDSVVCRRICQFLFDLSNFTTLFHTL